MKYSASIAFGSLAAIVLFSAATARAGVGEAPPPVEPPPVGDNAPLFPTGFRFTVFAESANGNVDSTPQQTTTYTTTTITTTTTVAPAATPTPTGSQTPPNNTSILKASGPTTATGTVKHHRTTRRITSSDHLQHNALGGGVDLGYFFTPYFGVALEGDFLGGEAYNTVMTGNLIFRYPFEFGASPGGYSKDGKTTAGGPTWGLAPYALIGGGSQWDGHTEGIGDIGGGVEFAFPHDYGFFLEGRWIVHDARQSYAAETAGMTFGF